MKQSVQHWNMSAWASVNRVLFPIGATLVVFGVLMALPATVEALAGNGDWKAFAEGASAATILGAAIVFAVHHEESDLSLREGYLVTVAMWIVLPLVAALPFWFSIEKISFTDAVFEAVSGLTTTGSTVFSGLDAMAPGLLIWRAFLQWMGGIGIIVMAVIVLPFLRVGGMQLYRMESSDRSEKIAPRAYHAMLLILVTYTSLTALCAVLYWMSGMTSLEAAVHAMTTLSTGGFSTSDGSIGHFNSAAIEWEAVVFMMLGSLPFALYVKFFKRRRFSVWREDSQISVFVSLVVVAVILSAYWLVSEMGMTPLDALRTSAFNVVSIVTTTGFASGDFTLWGAFPIVLFFFLMFVGGCAGSTAGGVKMFRFELLAKEAVRQGRLLISPHAVYQTRLNDQPVNADIVGSVMVFFFLLIVFLTGATVLLGFAGLDFETSISAAVTAISNVGPGLGTLIGPSGNFASLPDSAKWILDICMIVGRLEYLTVAVVFLPLFWRDFA